MYLDPLEYRSTWLGNKAIYRTRMALADDAELIILAPGVKEFGEDRTIDELIRKYGYHGNSCHLGNGPAKCRFGGGLECRCSFDSRFFRRTFQNYLVSGLLTRQVVESVGFNYGNLDEMTRQYNPVNLHHGYNTINGEEIFFIANPGLGLWAYSGRF